MVALAEKRYHNISVDFCATAERAPHYPVRAILDTIGDPREVHTFAIWAGNVSSGLLKK
jgi:hypothetical protein